MCHCRFGFCTFYTILNLDNKMYDGCMSCLCLSCLYKMNKYEIYYQLCVFPILPLFYNTRTPTVSESTLTLLPPHTHWPISRVSMSSTMGWDVARLFYVSSDDGSDVHFHAHCVYVSLHSVIPAERLVTNLTGAHFIFVNGVIHPSYFIWKNSYCGDGGGYASLADGGGGGTWWCWW